MQALRSNHVLHVRDKAALVFGPKFKAEWFITTYNRGTEPELQALLGAKVTKNGKTYPLLPPILFPPGGSESKKDVFMNPALVKVSAFTRYVPLQVY